MSTRDEFSCYIKEDKLALKEYTLATQVDAKGVSVHEVRVITEIDSRLWYLTAKAGEI